MYLQLEMSQIVEHYREYEEQAEKSSYCLWRTIWRCRTRRIHERKTGKSRQRATRQRASRGQRDEEQDDATRSRRRDRKEAGRGRRDREKQPLFVDSRKLPFRHSCALAELVCMRFNRHHDQHSLQMKIAEILSDLTSLRVCVKVTFAQVSATTQLTISAGPR